MKTNKLARYGIAKAIICVHSDSQKFNHARVLFRDGYNDTRFVISAQRHRMDMDSLSGSLYPPKPKDYERPEAPFDFGETPLTGFYAAHVDEMKQSSTFDYFTLNKVALTLKTMSRAKEKVAPSQDELLTILRVLQYLNVPVEFVLQLGLRTFEKYESIPTNLTGHSFRYWAKERGVCVGCNEEGLHLFEDQKCSKCHVEPPPQRCMDCGEMKDDVEEYKGVRRCSSCIDIRTANEAESYANSSALAARSSK